MFPNTLARMSVASAACAYAVGAPRPVLSMPGEDVVHSVQLARWKWYRMGARDRNGFCIAFILVSSYSSFWTTHFISVKSNILR